MIQSMGVILLTVTGTGIGYIKSNRLARRVETAEQTVRFLQFIRTGIRYGSQPVEQLLEQGAVRFPALTLLGRCSELMQNGHSFLSAWKLALKEFLRTGSIGTVYHTLAEGFGEGLGMTDVEGELAHCDLYLSRFEELLDDVNAEYRSKGRLYVLLGGLTGLAAALLLI